MFSVGYQPSRTNIKFFSSMPKKAKGSETETEESQGNHTHYKLPPLTKLNQATSPWQRETSPWLQDNSPLWQPSFSPWQNDRASKSCSRTGNLHPVSRSSKTKRNKTVVRIGGVTAESDKQKTVATDESYLNRSDDSLGHSGRLSRKLSITTPVLDYSLETVKPPSRGQLQGRRTAPGTRSRESNSSKTFLFCPQRQLSDIELQNQFYMQSPEFEVDQEESLGAVGGIEDYKHLALRNPNHRTEIDLQRVYDRSYRPSLKLPKSKYSSKLVTNICPQFINNNCHASQQSPAQKRVLRTEHSNLSRNSSTSSTDIKSLSTLTGEEEQESRKLRIITPAKCSPARKQPSSERNLSWLSYKLPCGSAWGFRKNRTID